MLVIASPTAIRPEAAASSRATGAALRSPSPPRRTSRSWSTLAPRRPREPATAPPSDRGRPARHRSVADRDEERLVRDRGQAQARERWLRAYRCRRVEAGTGGTASAVRRAILGACRRAYPCGMSIGSIGEAVIADELAVARVAVRPTTANGQRSRRQSSASSGEPLGGTPARSAPGLHCTRFERRHPGSSLGMAPPESGAAAAVVHELG